MSLIESYAANKALVQRYCREVLNAPDSPAASEILAENYVFRGPHLPETRGAQAMANFLTVLRASAPDVRIEVTSLLAEADQVAMRWKETGTMTGEWMGAPPTGKPFQITGISILRIADGKIVEDYSETDMLGFYQQIGVAPPLAPLAASV